MQQRHPRSERFEQYVKAITDYHFGENLQTLTEVENIIDLLDDIKDSDLANRHNGVKKEEILIAQVCLLKQELEAQKQQLNTSMFDKIINHYIRFLQNRLPNYNANPAEAEKACIEAEIKIALPVRSSFSHNQDHNNAVSPLRDSIRALRNYGEGLLSYNHQEGRAAIDLANKLNTHLAQYVKKIESKKDHFEFEQFKAEFENILNSKNIEMKHYRKDIKTCWKTLLGNILIGLTGVGLIFIGARLAISSLEPKGNTFMDKLKEGRPLLFFAKTRTTREDRVDDIHQALEKTKLGA